MTAIAIPDRVVPAPIMATVNATVAFGAYLLFVGQVSKSELWTGGGLALAVAGWTIAARACHARMLGIGADHLRPWLLALAGLPWATLRTAGVLVAALFGRQGPGATVSPFVHGPADAAGDNGRRATAVLAASLAPDSFVVRTPQGEDKVLVHRLVAGNAPDPRWLT
ncbi:MAG: Na+/H+ antiporter subunit E [Sphingomonadaceae bacterium]|nr:Na+/H+ antiporter subunit E [Sphingomonadaceae bacterium]